MAACASQTPSCQPKVRLHRLEKVAVQPAHGQSVGATVKRERELTQFVALNGVDGGCAHHGTSVYLPKGLAAELLQQVFDRRADQVLHIGDRYHLQGVALGASQRGRNHV